MFARARTRVFLCIYGVCVCVCVCACISPARLDQSPSHGHQAVQCIVLLVNARGVPVSVLSITKYTSSHAYILCVQACSWQYGNHQSGNHSAQQPSSSGKPLIRCVAWRTSTQALHSVIFPSIFPVRGAPDSL